MNNNAFLIYLSFICAQIIFYNVSLRKAISSYWFLGLFYFLIFSCTQGLVIFCKIFSISFFAVVLGIALSAFLLKGGLRRVPQFQKKYAAFPDFYLFSALYLSLTWMGYLFRQNYFALQYNLIEAFLWSWFCAVLFPILAGIKERLQLNAPARFSPTGIFFIAAGFILLVLSSF